MAVSRIRAELAGAVGNCLNTQDPAQIDGAEIARLERAASFISGSVVLPNDVNRAACDGHRLHSGGIADATPERVNASF